MRAAFSACARSGAAIHIASLTEHWSAPSWSARRATPLIPRPLSRLVCRLAIDGQRIRARIEKRLEPLGHPRVALPRYSVGSVSMRSATLLW